MPRHSRSFDVMKPWAWLAAVAGVCLVLASSTALYAINSSVKLGLPWWTAVAAPALVYALVLPLCVPQIRPTGWLVGVSTLGVLHGLLGLVTTWLYATVGLTSFAEALAPAFWSFPPALVLEMVGSLLLMLPFLGALAPPAAPLRAQPEAPSPRAAAPKRAKQEALTVQEQGRHVWARPSEPRPAPAILSSAPPPVTAVAPVVEEPPVLEESLPVGASPMAAPEHHVVHAAPLAGTNGSAVEAAEASPEAAPDFRQALTELLGEPASETKASEETVPEPLPPRVADEEPSGLSAEAPAGAVPEPSVAPPAEVRPETPEPAAPAVAGEMVRIPFDRVVGQLPPGAFRVPLAQVGARLREAETLLVAQGLIVPQLGEGVVQVAWEAVVEQFPPAVFAVAPAEVKERIVNGRLLLPLDEIVRQLPPDVFGASMSRGPVEVPGIESFPAPFKPLGWDESTPTPAPAPAPVAPEVMAAPPVASTPVSEPAPPEHEPAVESARDDARHAIEVPSAAEVAEDLSWTPPPADAIEAPLAEQEAAEVSVGAAPTDGLALESSSESVTAASASDEEAAPDAGIGTATVEPTLEEAAIRIPFDRVMSQLPSGAFRVPVGQVGARLRQPDTLLVSPALIVPQLGEGAVQVAWEVVVGQFPAEVFTGAPPDVKEQIEGGQLVLPLDEIVRQLSPEVFAGVAARGPVQVPGIESFPAPFKPLGFDEPAPPVAVEPASAAARSEQAIVDTRSGIAPAPPEPVTAAAAPVSTPAPPAPPVVVAEPATAAAPQPVPVAPLYEAQVFERPGPAEPPAALPERRVHAEVTAALMAPLDTAALEEIHVGDLTVISMSSAGMPGGMVAAAAGRLTPLIARGTPHPIEQVTLRGLGGVLVLTPVGSGWTSGTTLAVGTRTGRALARLEMLARRAARHEPASPPPAIRGGAPFARLEAARTPPGIAAAAEDLTTFGTLSAQSFREPASGAAIHCLVSPGVSAAELAPFAWELAQAMAQSAPAEALGVFHSAILRSGSTRVEIRRLPSAAGLALILVVGGTDSGRPGLARLQVERTAARLSVA